MNKIERLVIQYTGQESEKKEKHSRNTRVSDVFI